MTLRPEFFGVCIGSPSSSGFNAAAVHHLEEQAGFPFRRLARDEEIAVPDHFDHDWRSGSRTRVFAALASLRPGVTEIHVQPALDTPEVRALTDDAEGWVDDHRLVVDDASQVLDAVERAGATRIGYRELRDAMQADVPDAPPPHRTGLSDPPGWPDRRQAANREKSTITADCSSTAAAIDIRRSLRPCMTWPVVPSRCGCHAVHDGLVRGGCPRPTGSWPRRAA
ncbi:MAG: hypothetical protein R2705_11310 [Ilumatobacteraceae bacterium]